MVRSSTSPLELPARTDLLELEKLGFLKTYKEGRAYVFVALADLAKRHQALKG